MFGSYVIQGEKETISNLVTSFKLIFSLNVDSFFAFDDDEKDDKDDETSPKSSKITKKKRVSAKEMPQLCKDCPVLREM